MPAAERCTVYTDEGCPYAERVFLTLEELSIPYTTQLVDLRNKTKEYITLYQSVSLDPTATIRVPLFEDADGTRLIESLVIVEYLIRKQGAGSNLFPSAPAANAKVRLFTEVFTGQFVPHFYKILRQPENVAQHVKTLRNVMTVLDAYLRTHGSSKSSSQYFEEHYSFAELAATPHLKRMLVTLPELRNVDLMQIAAEMGLHRLTTWMKAAIARPSAKRALANDKKLIEAAHEISKE